jgi:hypothetical protein
VTRDEIVREVVDASLAVVKNAYVHKPKRPTQQERRVVLPTVRSWERLEQAVETYLESEEE